jgi:hypothetical protein
LASLHSYTGFSALLNLICILIERSFHFFKLLFDVALRCGFTHNIIHSRWWIDLLGELILRIVKRVVDGTSVKPLNPVLNHNHLIQVILLSYTFGLLWDAWVLRINRILAFLSDYRNKISQLLVHDFNLSKNHLEIFLVAFFFQKRVQLIFFYLWEQLSNHELIAHLSFALIGVRVLRIKKWTSLSLRKLFSFWYNLFVHVLIYKV